MILRTPPPRKRRAAAESSPAGSGGHLVIYEDPPESSHDPSDQMLCTYQCQQLVKSDLLDNYASMERSIDDYQSKLEKMNENLLKAEAEAKNYKHLLDCAEQELSAARGREKALQEKVLMEANDYQERLKKQIQRCNELEVELGKEQSSRKTSESLVASAEERANLSEKKLKHLSDNTEREKKSLQDELMHIKQDSNLSVSRIKANLERVESRAVSAEKESRLVKEQLEEVKEQYRMSLCEKSELEKKLNCFTSLKEDSTSQSDILVKHLQEQLRSFESEVHEARKLKASCENIELLKEKLIEEKQRRERVEAEVLKLQEAQIMTKMLDDELSLWKNVIKDIPGVSSCDDIPLKFAALQKEVIDNMSKLGEANARLKQLEVVLASAELDKKHAETDSALAREMANSLKLEVKELESRLSSITEERNLLKNVEPGSEAVNRTRTQELESCLALKDSYCKELENKLIEQKATSERCYNEIRLLNEKLNSEERRIKSLEREGNQLRSEIALLESKLGHGDFSTASTKVLRMVNALGVDNEARQTIEALQSELQKAHEKLKVVEELKQQSGDAGQLVDSYTSGKIVQLKEQIATLEKREERYKTVFADRISVFRRACCELFGYKIVMDERQRANGIPVTRFTLQSIYAQNDEEKLEFEYESGNTNIMTNDYTKQPEVSQQVEIFIRKLNSIPAFTANLTVETFNRRTLS